MSKGKTFSDFSALKSILAGLPAERQGDIGRRPEKKSGQAGCMQRKRDEKVQGPDVGTKVVLMDSDLKGRVIGTGRTVKIELEDGLVIETCHDGFAIADPAEEELLRSAGTTSPTGKDMDRISGHATSNIRKTGPNTMEVDLHMETLPGGRTVPEGHRLEYQIEYFRKALRANLRHRGMKISFIHGVGDGILRSLLCKELDEIFALKCTYSSSPAVTVVTVR